MKKIFATSLLLVGTFFLTGCTTTISTEVWRSALENYINAKVDSDAKVVLGDVVGAETNEYFGDIVIDEFKQCPLSAPGDDDVLIMFADYPRSNGWTIGLGSWARGYLQLPWIDDITIPAGRYEVSLAAHDSYDGRYLTSSVEQSAEQFRVEIQTSPTYSIKTNSTGDLKDFYKTAVWLGAVNSDDGNNTGNAYIAGNDSIRLRAIHSESGVTPSAHDSVRPVCAVFKKLPFPEKECPFVATNPGDVLVNFDAGIRSDRGVDKAEASEDATILAGDYKVSLYAFDASTYRTKQSQPHEQYYVDLLDNNGNSIIKSNKTEDLEDNVQIATNQKVVNETLTVDKVAVTVVARHGAYPDTSSANSMKAVCALFEKKSEAPTPTPTPTPACVPTYSCEKTTVDCVQNCGQTMTETATCYKKDDCGTNTSVAKSECVSHGVACADSEKNCLACPDIIDWVEITP